MTVPLASTNDNSVSVDTARRRAARPLRFAVLFAVFLVTGIGLVMLPPVQVIDGQFSRVLVRVSGGLIHICGGKANTMGAVLGAPSGFAIEMQEGCNGVDVTILLWAAILAYPASWKMKVLGLVTGSLAIQVANVARFISLFYIGQYSIAWFDFAHAYLWETLLILDTMVVLWVWVNRASRTEAVPDARD